MGLDLLDNGRYKLNYNLVSTFDYNQYKSLHSNTTRTQFNNLHYYNAYKPHPQIIATYEAPTPNSFEAYRPLTRVTL